MLSEQEISQFKAELGLMLDDKPRWVAPFRKSFYKDASLPFLVVYQAVGVMKSGLDKSGAIAVATASLQDKGLLEEGTNTLSFRGNVREFAKMGELGKSIVEEYIQRFEASK
jgi:hypothetical protein